MGHRHSEMTLLVNAGEKKGGGCSPPEKFDSEVGMLQCGMVCFGERQYQPEKSACAVRIKLN